MTDNSEPNQPASTSQYNRKRRRSSIGVLVLLAVLAMALAWWRFAGRETTEDAQIEGHVHPIAARVEGPVVAVHVKENQRVDLGDILFEIDPRNYELAVIAAEADWAEAKAAAQAARVDVPITRATANSGLQSARADEKRSAAGVTLAEQSARVGEAHEREAKARHTRARQERERLTSLVERNEISRQRYDDVVAEETAAAAALEAITVEREMGINRLEQAQVDRRKAKAEVASAATAPQKIEATEAKANSAEARLAQAAAALDHAKLQLEYSKVRAPASGVVSRKRVEIGQFLRAGQAVLAVVDLSDVWAVANFKETQLTNIKPGQSVRVHVDAYPGLDLEGEVESLSPATGARFSLLPPDNATGNFVKVVQRVPVKIVLTKDFDPAQPLRPGMSIVATVITRARQPEAAEERNPKP